VWVESRVEKLKNSLEELDLGSEKGNAVAASRLELNPNLARRHMLMNQDCPKINSN
jgi:hypothetical protein